MSGLNKAKVLYGPATVTITGTTTSVTWQALKHDMIAITVNQEEIDVELEDGSKIPYFGGGEAIMEISVSELDLAASGDIIDINSDCTSVAVAWDSGTTLTMSSLGDAGSSARASVEGNKTKLRVRRTCEAGVDAATLITSS